MISMHNNNISFKKFLMLAACVIHEWNVTFVLCRLLISVEG